MAPVPPPPVDGYASERDRPDPDRTSRMSPYLKFGSIHPRTILADLGPVGISRALAARGRTAGRLPRADRDHAKERSESRANYQALRWPS